MAYSRLQSTVSLQRLSRTPYPRASPPLSQVPSRRHSEYRQVASGQRASDLLRQHQLHIALDSQVSQQRKALEARRDQELQLDTSAISLCKAQERHFRAQQTHKRLAKIATRQQLEREHRSSVQRQSFEAAKQQEKDRKSLYEQLRLHHDQLHRAKAEKARVKGLLQAVITANLQATSEKRQSQWREVEQDMRFQRELQRKLDEEELRRGCRELNGAVAGLRGTFERRRQAMQRRQQSEYREKLDQQVAEKRQRGWQEWREAQVTRSTLF